MSYGVLIYIEGQQYENNKFLEKPPMFTLCKVNRKPYINAYVWLHVTSV